LLLSGAVVQLGLRSQPWDEAFKKSFCKTRELVTPVQMDLSWEETSTKETNGRALKVRAAPFQKFKRQNNLNEK